MSKCNLVMIVDDNDFDRCLSTGLLRSSDFACEIIEFDSARLAINYLEVNKDILEKIPDVIFLDIYMPLMDGFEFVNDFKLLSSKIIKKCKICVFSTTVKDEHIFKAKNLNENVIFTSKPITLEFLKNIKPN